MISQNREKHLEKKIEELKIEAKEKMAKNDKKGTMERSISCKYANCFDMYVEGDADGFSNIN